MKRFFSHSPASFFTCLIGLMAVAFPNYFWHAPASHPKLFDVTLEPIEVLPFRRPPNEAPAWHLGPDKLHGRTLVADTLQDVERAAFGGGAWDPKLSAEDRVPKGIHTALIAKSDDRIEIKRYDNAPLTVTQAVSVNDRVGYAAGYSARGMDPNRWEWHSPVVRTDDGGLTWRELIRDASGSGPNDLLVVSSEVVFVSFTGRDLYRTTDGGKTWTKLIDSELFPVGAVAMAPDGKLWIVGDNSISVSDDLGSTWTPISTRLSTLSRNWFDVSFSENGIGVAVSVDGAIALTKDNGETWNLATSNLHVSEKIPLTNGESEGEGFYEVHLLGKYGLIRRANGRHYLMTIH